MPTINTGQHNIHYFYNGVSAAQTKLPNLVFIHGAGGRIQGWPYQWKDNRFVRSRGNPRRITDFPVYMLDLPGHGESPAPSCTTIADYADVAIAFSEALSLQNVVYAGISMGAAICLEIGTRTPPHIAGIILMGGGARMIVSDAILNGLQTDFTATVEMITKFSWHRSAADSFKTAGLQHMLTTDPAVVHGDFLACSTFDLRDSLDQITTPALVVGGSKDKMMPIKNSITLAEQLPHGELVVVEDAGHIMMVEKTSTVSRAMIRYLNDTVSSTIST